MFDFHKDKLRYFNIQYCTSKEYIIPFVEGYIDFTKDLKILEIGCAEAGVLKAFTDRGFQTVGIELNPDRVELAKGFMKEELESGRISFITKNIYDINTETDLSFKFDLIILKDVIEHIHNQEKFIPKLKDFLNPNGKVFFAFPPWYMPFGGHQQIADNKLLSKLPYYHLLPKPIYKMILKMFGENQRKIDGLLEIKETGISIERFENIYKKVGFKTIAKQHYLINPIYKWKFNLDAKKQFSLISKIPYLRNFFTSCSYYLVG